MLLTSSATTLCLGAQKAAQHHPGGRAAAHQRARCLVIRNAQLTLDVPAPVVVGGVLFVAALTKGGHPGWGVGGCSPSMSSAPLCGDTKFDRHADIRRRALGAGALQRDP